MCVIVTKIYLFIIVVVRVSECIVDESRIVAVCQLLGQIGGGWIVTCHFWALVEELPLEVEEKDKNSNPNSN